MAARSRQHCFARQEQRLAQSSQQFFSSTADQQGTGLTNTNLGPNLSLTRAMPCCAPTFADQPGTATTSWCSTVATGAEQISKDVMAGGDYLIAQGIAGSPALWRRWMGLRRVQSPMGGPPHTPLLRNGVWARECKICAQ